MSALNCISGEQEGALSLSQGEQEQHPLIWQQAPGYLLRALPLLESKGVLAAFSPAPQVALRRNLAVLPPPGPSSECPHYGWL